MLLISPHAQKKIPTVLENLLSFEIPLNRALLCSSAILTFSIILSLARSKPLQTRVLSQMFYFLTIEFKRKSTLESFVEHLNILKQFF
jgi:hypothetical protein